MWTYILLAFFIIILIVISAQLGRIVQLLEWIGNILAKRN